MSTTDRSTFAPAIPPYLYKVLWDLAVSGPLTAAEVAEGHNRSKDNWLKWTSQAAANRLRSAQKLGLVDREPTGFWLLTERGRAWMHADAEEAA